MARAMSKTGVTSRIRFIMVEAEMADGEITQVTQAIQNALRPSHEIKRIAAPVTSKTIARELQEPALEPEIEEEAQQVDTAPQAPRVNGPRKPAPTPDVLDLDLTTEPSLASHAKKANPKSHHKRYLVIAAWFKEH